MAMHSREKLCPPWTVKSGASISESGMDSELLSNLCLPLEKSEVEKYTKDTVSYFCLLSGPVRLFFFSKKAFLKLLTRTYS